MHLEIYFFGASLCYYIHFYLSYLRVFRTSISWWFVVAVWGTTSHLKMSSTLLTILTDLKIAVVLMVSTRSVISMFSRTNTNPLVIGLRARITIGIILTFMFHSFFNSIARPRYLSFFSHSFNFTLWSVGTTKSAILKVLFFCWLLKDLMVWPRNGDPFACLYFEIPVLILCCAYTICSYGENFAQFLVDHLT